MEIKGAQFCVRLERRGKNDSHVAIQIMSEDDEHWFEVGRPFSSFWLDDLISALQAAKLAMESLAEKEPNGYGWRFK